MNEFGDPVKTLAAHADQKSAITNRPVERGVRVCAAELVFAGDEDRFERPDDPADFGEASINERGESVHIGDFRPNCREPSRTSPACSRAREAHGTTWCGRPVTCAISSATMKLSTKSARRFFKSRGSIRYRRQRASRHISAAGTAGGDRAIAMFRNLICEDGLNLA